MTSVLAWAVLATVTAADTVPLSEADAVALAVSNSPQVKARVHQVDEARALSQVALRWNNPLLHIAGARYDRLVEPALQGEDYSMPLAHTTVGLRWSPPELGQRGARYAEGLAGEAGAETNLVLARRDTRALVRKLHAQILGYDAQITLGREVIEQRKKLRDLVKARLDEHAATLLDQSLSDIDYLDALSELGELEVRRRAAHAQLLVQLGMPAGTSLALIASGAGCTDPGDPVTLAEHARKSNPRLSLFRAQISAAVAERRQKSLALLPWIDYLQVAYGFATPNNESYVAFQLQLILPLLDWKRGDRRALDARRDGLEERIQAEDREMTDFILQTAAAQAERAALVKRYREAAGVVDSGLTHLREAMAAGQITNLFEIVQLQTRLLATQRSFLRAELDCKLYQIELDRVTGAGQQD